MHLSYLQRSTDSKVPGYNQLLSEASEGRLTSKLWLPWLSLGESLARPGKAWVCQGLATLFKN